MDTTTSPPPPNPSDTSAPPTAAPKSQFEFPCKQCGANLKFDPGTDSLKCPYCATVNEVQRSEAPVLEEDFLKQLSELSENGAMQDTVTVKCPSCAAETTLPPNTTAAQCPFCGTGIVATASTKKQLKPRSLLPFKVTQHEAAERFRSWVKSLWFAPSALGTAAERSQIKGAYLPAWTYDSDCDTWYTGERGDDYWETETYTETVNGETVTRTRQVQRTRWSYVRGRVFNHFDDVLVMASQSLPRKHLDALQPWDLPNLVPYGDAYLSGFVSESYQIDLPQGFVAARQIMAGPINQTICRQIGGNHQRVHSANTNYTNITFKHLLLPVWISAYLYLEKSYRFVVNARTGQVRGERPYSAIKIAALVISIILAIALIAFLVNRR